MMKGQEMMNDERGDSNVSIKCALGQHNMVHISEVYKQTFRIYLSVFKIHINLDSYFAVGHL